MSNIHGDDIAYTLSEERILYPDEDKTDLNWEYIVYCFFGIMLLLVGLYNMAISKKRHLLKFLSAQVKDHVELTISTALLGYLLIISEFIAISVRIADDMFFGLHVYPWLATCFSLFYVGYSVVIGCVSLKRRLSAELSTAIKDIFLGLVFILFYLHVYCYALPTFLLLLVYPTNMIAVVAYLIAVVFVASAILSVCLRMCIIGFTNRSSNSRCGYLMTCITIIMNTGFFFAFPIFMTLLMFKLLYDIVLSEASPITAGPYTVLSLIPSVAISVATWMIKNKVFSDTTNISPITSDGNRGGEGNQTRNLSSDDHVDGERLLLVANGDSPAENQTTYGSSNNV